MKCLKTIFLLLRWCNGYHSECSNQGFWIPPRFHKVPIVIDSYFCGTLCLWYSNECDFEGIWKSWWSECGNRGYPTIGFSLWPRSDVNKKLSWKLPIVSSIAYTSFQLLLASKHSFLLLFRLSLRDATIWIEWSKREKLFNTLKVWDSIYSRSFRIQISMISYER